jgi:hypothetical protein
MARTRYWMGSLPTRCEMTSKPIIDRFVDGATKNGGPWGILHPDTFASYGYTPAPGVGQLYEKQPDGRWMKIEG